MFLSTPLREGADSWEGKKGIVCARESVKQGILDGYARQRIILVSGIPLYA